MGKAKDRKPSAVSTSRFWAQLARAVRPGVLIALIGLFAAVISFWFQAENRARVAERVNIDLESKISKLQHENTQLGAELETCLERRRDPPPPPLERPVQFYVTDDSDHAIADATLLKRRTNEQVVADKSGMAELALRLCDNVTVSKDGYEVYDVVMDHERFVSPFVNVKLRRKGHVDEN